MALPIVYSFVMLVAALIVVYIVFKLGKLILALLSNIVLGFVSLFLINMLFGMDIAMDLPAIVITAILGVLGAAVLVVLKFLGIAI